MSVALRRYTGRVCADESESEVFQMAADATHEAEEIFTVAFLGMRPDCAFHSVSLLLTLDHEVFHCTVLIGGGFFMTNR